jgi:ribokinase
MIVVFGSINVDLVARVARMPHPGETLAGESFAIHAGGKGANQALAARRAGAAVAFIGAVGDDMFAATALGGLADAKVDLTRVRRVKAATGVGLIHVDARGENSITIVAGANAHAASADVPDALLAPGTTVLLQLEVPLPEIVELAARAHARGARVIQNAAPWRPLPPALFSSLDLLVVNEIEAASVADALDLPAASDAFAAAFHRDFGCACAVTLGAQGALAAAEGNLIRAHAPVVDIVDTTGAGDAFAGALAAALDRSMPWDRALAHGVAAGSLACTAAGAQSALPSATTIEKLAAGMVLELFPTKTD